jgi:antitoxin (DNA-binding transcriptional repressor) of toxin-antitoxin stability system
LAVRTVGVRELKSRLSEYLRLVRQGEEILVTDRDQVVAEIRLPSRAPESTPYPGLEAAVRKGLVRPGAPNDPALYLRLDPLMTPEDVAALLDAERGDR